MQTRVAKEYKELTNAMTALSNSFGYTDEDVAWAGDEETRADVWWDACASARRVQDAAEGLAAAARKRVRELEAALDEATG